MASPGASEDLFDDIHTYMQDFCRSLDRPETKNTFIPISRSPSASPLSSNASGSPTSSQSPPLSPTNEIDQKKISDPITNAMMQILQRDKSNRASIGWHQEILDSLPSDCKDQSLDRITKYYYIKAICYAVKGNLDKTKECFLTAEKYLVKTFDPHYHLLKLKKAADLAQCDLENYLRTCNTIRTATQQIIQGSTHYKTILQGLPQNCSTMSVVDQTKVFFIRNYCHSGLKALNPAKQASIEGEASFKKLIINETDTLTSADEQTTKLRECTRKQFFAAFPQFRV